MVFKTGMYALNFLVFYSMLWYVLICLGYVSVYTCLYHDMVCTSTSTYFLKLTCTVMSRWPGFRLLCVFTGITLIVTGFGTSMYLIDMFWYNIVCSAVY